MKNELKKEPRIDNQTVLLDKQTVDWAGSRIHVHLSINAFSGSDGGSASASLGIIDSLICGGILTMFARAVIVLIGDMTTASLLL